MKVKKLLIVQKNRCKLVSKNWDNAKGNKKFYWKSDFCRFFLMKWVGICLIWRPLSENYTNTKTLLYARLVFDQPFSLKEFKGKWEQRPPFLGKKKKVKYTPKVKLIFAFRRLVRLRPSLIFLRVFCSEIIGLPNIGWLVGLV